ncbi:dipeptidylpeptidase [Linnemannia schmuckeri]|uniref:Dipeptidylpeptidase n=1 Tax=Linnemannia schmuckeri TaxID=64567 RepID=A0A9P5RW43_9FUNG|nr:dipeptidylpeptidase [Linnemannia schmuckeri]
MASWDQIRNDVRSFRASVQPTVTTIRDFSFDSNNDRIFFFANDLSKSSKSPMLFRVDLPKSYSDKETSSSSSSTDSDLDSDLEDLSSDQHSNSTGLDQEDHDMDLVPFDPATYQHFTIPSATPIQIITGGSGPRNLYAAPDRNSFSSTSQPTAPENAASATGGVPESGSSVTDQILAAAPVLPWVPVLSEEWIKYSNSALGHSPTDRLSFYQFEPQVNRLMFPYGAAIYTGSIQENGKFEPQAARTAHQSSASSPNRSYSNLVHNALAAGINLVSVSGPLASPRTPLSNSTASNLDKGAAASSSTRADPKLGGSELDLVAFTRDQDIWVMTLGGVETQLTFCSRNKKKSDISCGIAEFVMQEEFHRFSNYCWAPSTPSQPSPPPRFPTPTTNVQSASPPQTVPSMSSTQPHPQHSMQHYQHHDSFSPSPATSSPNSTFTTPSPTLLSPPILSESFPVPAVSTSSSRTTERILYLQVSEAMVDLVVIPRQGMHPEFEEYRYPHAGTPNAVSDIQIVEFVPRLHDDDVVPEPLHKRLWGRVSLYKMFPWIEYIVRFGWLPGGESVWVQILDRRQQNTAILAIPLDCFMSVAEQAESTEQTEDELASRIRIIFEERSDYWINVTDITQFLLPEEFVLDEDATRDDIIQFIVPSERTGFRHLYLATHSTRIGSKIVPITSGNYQVVDKSITVDTKRQLVYFTAKRDSVLETHLYVASYANGAQPGNVKRLTELGYSHQVTVDVTKNRFLTMYSSVDHSPACANVGRKAAEWCMCGCQFPKISSHAYVLREGIANLAAKRIRQAPIVSSSTPLGHARSRSESFVNPPRIETAFGSFKTGSMNSISGFLASHLLSSNLLSSPKSIQLQAQPQQQDSGMVLSSSVGAGGRKSSLRFVPTTQASSSAPSSSSSTGGVINAAHHPVAEFFTFMSSDNVQLHGCLYRPANYNAGQKYPTLVSIYGGPRSQMVTNEYKLPKFLRVFLATQLGYAVVMIDGRGSNDRGVEFEGRLRYQMGQIEVRDQVEGLQFLAKPENGGLVDINRVAISGWSYGGYLTLMALAQYPQIFKIAIAGAPVTQWELYNTAYTERYMGLVQENKEGYDKSNLLNWVDRFPDSENRLLIAHGLIDENVHFKNTEMLVADLIRSNKPHQIQIYPTERHGLRDARVNEHFETLMFWLLKKNL